LKKAISWGVLSVILSFIQGVFLARLLTVDIRGEISLVVTFLNLILPLCTMGLKQSISYTFNREGNIALPIKMFIKIIAIVTFLILGSLVAFLVYKSTFIFMLPELAIFYIARTVFDILCFTYILSKRVDSLNKLICFRLLIDIIALVFLNAIGADTTSYIILMYGFSSLLCLFILVITNKTVAQSATDNLSFNVIVKKGVLYGLPLFFIGLNTSFDSLMLGYFIDTKAVAFYHVAVSLAAMLWILPNLLSPIFFSNSLGKGIKESKSLILKMFLLYSSFIIPIVISVFISPFVFSIIYGPVYVDASKAFNILIFAYFIMLPYKIINPFLAANGFVFYPTVIFAFGFVLNFILNIELIPLFGIVGASYSTLVSYGLCSLMFILYYLKVSNVK